MKKVFAIIVVILALALFGAWPALADHYTLRFEDASHMQAHLDQNEYGTPVVTAMVQPVTADRTPGPAILRIDGVCVAQWSAPPYVYHFVPGQDIPLYEGKQLCPYLNSGVVHSEQSVLSADTYMPLPVQLEATVWSVDDRGRIDDNRRSDATITLNFSSTSDSSSVPQGIGQDQVKTIAGQAYQQGVTDEQSAFAGDREKMEGQIQQLTGDNNQLRQQLAMGSSPSGTTFKVVLDPGEQMPAKHQEMNLVECRTGKIVAQVWVTQNNLAWKDPYSGRLQPGFQVSGNIPSTIDLYHGYSIEPERHDR